MLIDNKIHRAIIRAYRRGATAKELGQKHGLSEREVYELLVPIGVQRPRDAMRGTKRQPMKVGPRADNEQPEPTAGLPPESDGGPDEPKGKGGS